MMMRRRFLRTITLAALAICALAAPASAQVLPPSQVQPYGTNDYGGFHNILPPGQCHNINGAELADFQLRMTIPPDCQDQRLMYQDLIHATPGLQASQIDDFYKDGSFGAKPKDVARTYQPNPITHPGLTITRDNFNVPHIYGATRPDVMFGAGYAGAEDRLFFMDVLRHAGRAQLAEFAGGSNKGMDAEQWDVAPYAEQDLQKQYDLADDVYGQEGTELKQDVDDYIAGINQYIAEALATPALKMPGEYAAIGKPLEPWKVTDVIATASLIGGIFGKGGGGEVGNAQVLESAIAKYGNTGGTQAWQDFRRANDPEADTTVHDGQSFPYQDRPGTDPFSNPAVAMPDPGSIQEGSPDDAPDGGHSPLEGLLGPLGGMQGASNALLVSANESQSGHPEVVFGPQVAYFAPEILMEEDLHGPDIDARGATFVGVNLYVLLGRGQDYAWSATSAGQDIIDTFAEKLCNIDGSPATINSMGYLWKAPGESTPTCRPIEILNRDEHITPNAGDDNGGRGPEDFHLQAQRTVHGIISKRATVNGQPVAYAKLRSTYFHEADSARAFSDLNQPSKVQNASDFQNVMSKINFTFNWFYADDQDISYFNSGNNPVRAPGTDPEFPTWGTGDYDWQGWKPVVDTGATGLSGGTNEADYTPFAEHPKVTNQDYISSWNNKQAPGYRAAEDNYSYGPNHRVQSLSERIEASIAGSSTMSLPELIDAMEDAGSVDLRGSQDLALMLDVIGSGGVPGGLQGDVNTLQGWVDSGAHRRDRDRNGSYDDNRAVAIMDAWWPKALTAAFQPTMGSELFNSVFDQMSFDDPPNQHVGSAYIDGWEGYLNKDLRSLLGRPVSDPFSRVYCGGGDLAACKTALVTSLQDAIGVVDGSGQYPAREDRCPLGNDQMCADAIQFRTVGGIAIPDIEWINRPTWQQAVEVQGHRGRSQPINPGGGPDGGTGGGFSGSGPNASGPAGATGGGKRCRKPRAKKGAQAAKKKRCAKKKRAS